MNKASIIPTTKVTSVAPALADIEQLVRERAYQRFVERGSEPGRALDDWLAAERSLIIRQSFSLTEVAGSIVVVFDVGNASPDQIQLKTDGRVFLVQLHGPVHHPGKKNSSTSHQLFCAIELPWQVDKNTVHADYRDGNLEILAAPEKDHGYAMQLTA
jgi:hypothetical protein